ncbi:hypothetical protein HanRHA438_Chr11g0518721 [Helianthus annuus]|uniref:Uncharacterized protein n=2 Tax=Helianthus annuus TaxID=4232 RepID=A0A9K3HS61_HELAN|nr:hypothetical protein HanXRQr2_Chr11g0506251 [Helianthus annuus]KAJ0625075.1 hypothetical protein HanIR_Chr01g0049861 [Helianthus annuus]KAJ0871992.1 hypothetical protein HanRHA438_Chr11g0518721 [Helianthus annuus]KAJ0958943.1 hypothetical protein HanPSC8_Chr01g0044471 [Helianthus annuus]
MYCSLLKMRLQLLCSKIWICLGITIYYANRRLLPEIRESLLIIIIMNHVNRHIMINV